MPNAYETGHSWRLNSNFDIGTELTEMAQKKHRQQNQNPQVGAHQTEKFLEQPAEEKGKLPSEVFTNCTSHKGLVLKT